MGPEKTHYSPIKFKKEKNIYLKKTQQQKKHTVKDHSNLKKKKTQAFSYGNS